LKQVWAVKPAEKDRASLSSAAPLACSKKDGSKLFCFDGDGNALHLSSPVFAAATESACEQLGEPGTRREFPLGFANHAGSTESVF
jgi:hypothetical protein